MSNSVEKCGLGYIRPRHREMARMLAVGMTNVQIARYFGMDQSRVSIITNSPLFKLEVAKIESSRQESVQDIRNQLLEVAPAAAEELERILYKGENEKIRMAAAEAILDRAGIERKGAAIGVQVNLALSPVDLSKYRSEPEHQEHINGEIIENAS